MKLPPAHSTPLPQTGDEGALRIAARSPGSGLQISRPLVVGTAGYITGIALGRLWLADPLWAGWAAGLAAALLSVLVWRRLLSLFMAVLPALLAVAGTAYFFLSSAPASGGILDYAGSLVTVEGTVVAEPLYLEDHSAYRLRVEAVTLDRERRMLAGTLLVKLYGAQEESYWFGERLRLRAVIVEPKGRRNPGGFDYRLHLRSQGIDALAYPAAHQISSLGPGDPGRLTASLVRLRLRMVEGINHNLPSPSAELLSAILFGRRLLLPPEILANFTRSGTGHLMAVSGLNVGLVAALILSLWRRLGLKGKMPLAVAIALIWIYALLTGLSPSVVRAALMLSLTLGALLLDRERDIPTAIALSALVALTVNPLTLFTVSFQLSYIATLSIIYLSPPLLALLARLRLPEVLLSLTAVTLAAQLGVLPLSSFLFAHLPLAALFFNLLLIPLMAPLIGLGLSGAALYTVAPPLAAPLLWGCRPLLELTLFITGLARFPGLYLAVYPPSLLELILIYAAGTGLLFIFYRFRALHTLPGQTGLASFSADFNDGKRPFDLAHLSALLKHKFSLRLPLMIAAVLAVAVIIVWSGILFLSAPELTVTFIDVGQGAAVLVQAPCGANILLDGGGTPSYQGHPGEIGERTLLPLLRDQGIRRLDLLIISHPHEDHFGGLLPLLGSIPISRLLISPVEGESPYYLELLKQAEALMIPLDYGYDGQRLASADDPRLRMEILHPPQKLLPAARSVLNNNSLVIRLSYGRKSILFTGDIEQEGVQYLLSRKEKLQADILQVPHHGGYLPNIENLLSVVKPGFAVIPVGSNLFGHPHPELLSALQEAGVTVFRTDHHGAVILKTNGESFHLKTMSGERALSPAALRP